MSAYQPKDPAIAAAVASLVLTLQQAGAFARVGLSSDDVLFWSSIGVIALTAARAVWFKFWPESATAFWSKGSGVPGEVAADPTKPEGIPRGHAAVWVLGAAVALFVGVPLAMAAPWIAVAAAIAGLLVAGAVTLRRWSKFMLFVPCLAMLAGCAGYQGPGLESVTSRISVEKAIECARRPGMEAKARCLGTEALTVGLGVALDQASYWGERALHAVSGTGADDMSPRAKRDLARNTEDAMRRLEAEIAHANGGPNPTW